MNSTHRLEQDRRLFLRSGAAMAALGMVGRASADETTESATRSEASTSSNERLTIGIMGVNGRGRAIAKGMLALGDVHIASICDVDERAASRVAEEVNGKQSVKTKVVEDFRRILDDPSVDALVCAAPNHWHAPATILGCAAGKHVYVEKPCSHTPAEGEMAVAAARRNNRVVQMGTQRRSWPGIMEAVQKAHDGTIGEVLYARTWYNNRRPSIGIGQVSPAPKWLNWNLWQGPAPRQSFKDNVVHYNWHWHWKWGNGELGNNGVHALDVARWAMKVKYPIRVTAGGNKSRHQDDQETPDTMMVTYEFPHNKTITWEGLSWSPHGPDDSMFGISLHGTEGTIVIRGSGYTHYDMQRKEVGSGTGVAGDQSHFADFVQAVRSGKRPNADIEKAHQSTLLCHLGNIAYRTSGVLSTNPANGHIVDDQAAEALWTREYEPGWEPVI